MRIKPNEAATLLINKAFNSNDHDGYSRLKLKSLIKLDRLTLKRTSILICLCKLEAFDAEEGSIAHEVATNICIVRINKERLESLRQIPY